MIDEVMAFAAVLVTLLIIYVLFYMPTDTWWLVLIYWFMWLTGLLATFGMGMAALRHTVKSFGDDV